MSRSGRQRILFVLISASLVVSLLSGGFLGAGAREFEDDPYKYLSVFTEVLRLVRTVYVEEPDIDTLMAGAMDGATDALDPFSFYVPARKAKSFDAADRVGRQRSGLLVLKERGVAFVASVDPGGAGEKAGVRRGDIVSELEERSTRDMPMWELHQFFAGPVGSTVRVEIVRQGKPIPVELELQPSQAPPPKVTELEGQAVLKLHSFDSETLAQTEALLAELSDRPLLIDLRGVAGGEASVAYDVASLFVNGELGELRKQDETLELFEADKEPVHRSELSLLVDRGSQGAAEILVSVLVQIGGALVLGESTFGHAGSSERVSLASGAFINLTRAFYTGPDREPIDEGLEPDVVVRRRRVDADSDGDEVLQRAIEALRERAGEQRKAA